MKFKCIRIFAMLTVLQFCIIISIYAQTRQIALTASGGSARVSLEKITWIQSSAGKLWNESNLTFAGKKELQPDAMITENQLQVIDGFGACFNELGWTSLAVLDDNAREKILKDLFDEEEGLRLNICRMPIGANDYALNYYSLNDSAEDLEMKYFNIERDKKNLIPYIKAAQKYRSDLRIWGSPWTPPAWMKSNSHYACRPDVVNDMTPEQTGQEGITQFRMTPDYLNAYARYFVKYIQAYRNEGIHITAVHPQNEMNSCQNFPSCIWTATDLGNFIGNYLGPAIKSSFPDVQIWYGTYERPWVEKIDTIMANQEIARYISGVSFQWAGKQAIPGVHKKYPELKLMQSETECGDGSNDWKAAEFTFSLMKHYFNHGVSVYTFWNSILNETGKSMWGWKQNSMITIDSKSRQVQYNPEFYLLKHFSAFIDPGARMLEVAGKSDNLLAFRNPDGSIVMISGNPTDAATRVNVNIGDHTLAADLDPHTFNTFYIPSGETDEAYFNEDDFLNIPKYDVHCHIETERPAFMEAAAANNFRILTINVDAGSDIDEQLKFALIQKKMFPERLGFLTTFSMKGFEDNEWTAATIARIKKSMKKGALGVKMWKNIGMVEKNSKGNFIMIDDPKFDVIFNYLEKNRIPVLGHLGEPKNCWLPVEEMTVNNDRSYFKEHPQYHMYLHPEYPSYEDQINARDNMLRKHPGLIFIGAHMASLEWSVDELAKRLDEFPQMTFDLAARICHLQYQSQISWQKVHDFFIKYQDRILYGTDSGDDGERQADNLKEDLKSVWLRDWNYFTTGDIMTSPDVNGEFRGLRLPKHVVEKIYYKNADRLFQ